MTLELKGKQHRHRTHKHTFHDHSHKRLCLVALFQLVGSSLDRNQDKQNTDHCTDDQTETLRQMTVKHLYKAVRHRRDRQTFHDRNAPSSQCQIPCQGSDPRRDVQISDHISEHTTVSHTDQQHEGHGESHIHAVYYHHGSSYGTDKADERTTGKINVTAGQHTHQHTGCQYIHISILSDQRIKV